MSSKSRLVVVALLSAVALLLAPDLFGGFRSEDFLDFDWYSRHPLRATLTGTHLGSTMVTFWRPLSDACTWLVVRGVGPNGMAVHLLLVALSVAAAWSVGSALRDLFGLRPGAALTAALLAVVHPLAPAVVTYLDGGLALLLVAIATFQALAALGRWRDGGAASSGAIPLLLWTLAAMLAHDAAILLPVIACIIALLLPRSERRLPWWLLGLIPLLLLVRQLLLGKAFDGYGALADPDFAAKLAAFPGRVVRCGARLFAPAFPETIHGSSAGLVAAAVLAGVFAGSAVVAIATRRGGVATPLRQGLAALALVVGLLGMAPEFFVLGVKDPASGRPLEPDELVLAYKTYPAALAATLAIAWVTGRAASARWWGSLALATPVLALFLWLRAPIAAAHDEVLRWGRELPAALAAATADDPGARLLVLDVPVKNVRRAADVAPRSVTRAFQYGLPSALRPPSIAPERFVHPLFRVEDGMLDYFAQEAIDAFVACPWLRPLRCRLGPIADVVPVERVAARPSAIRLFANVDGVELVLAPDLANAPFVDFWREEFKDADGRQKAIDVIRLGVRGAAPGLQTLVVVNRMHPFYADFLFRESGANGVDRIYFTVPWLREVATRFPGDVVFAALQTRPDPRKSPAGVIAVDVSNVLPLRLRERSSRP